MEHQRPVDIVLLGMSHRSSDLETREAASFPACDLPPSLDEIHTYVPEGAILSTCHRIELYAATSDPAAARAGLLRFWADRRQLDPASIAGSMYFLNGARAIEHLFSVASGLDSAVIGEAQILGQVRESLNRGLERQAMGTVLAGLFRHAIGAGKRVRTETDIARNAASVSYAAVELARHATGDLKSCQVLLVGTGKMGELAARNLLDKGVGGFTIAGRTPERARQLALECGSALSLARLEDALPSSDIVITCTSAPHHVISADMLTRAMRQRAGRPMFVVDIAVPRDVDPEAARIPGVSLYNIDDLEAAVTANQQVRLAEARKAAEIIAEEVESFERWLRIRRVAPAIEALIERAEAIRQEELIRTESVLAKLSEDDRRRIEALTRSLQKKLLHQPIALLRREAENGDGIHAAARVRELFDL